MSDRTAEMHVAQVEHTNQVTAFVLSALATSLLGAACVELVLMVLLWIRSGWENGGDADFPGRYWFAVLPMLTAAAILHARGRTLRRS